jgi:hypothetical protein
MSIFPTAAARNPTNQSGAAVIPAQYAMGDKGLRRPGPATPDSTLTAGESKRLTDSINRLPSKKRKQLLKTLQSMNSEERKQFIQSVRQQFAAQDAAARQKQSHFAAK